MNTGGHREEKPVQRYYGMQRHNLWLKESLNDTLLEAGRMFWGRHLLLATTGDSDRGLDNAHAPIPLILPRVHAHIHAQHTTFSSVPCSDTQTPAEALLRQKLFYDNSYTWYFYHSFPSCSPWIVPGFHSPRGSLPDSGWLFWRGSNSALLSREERSLPGLGWLPFT